MCQQVAPVVVRKDGFVRRVGHFGRIPDVSEAYGSIFRREEQELLRSVVRHLDGEVRTVFLVTIVDEFDLPFTVRNVHAFVRLREVGRDFEYELRGHACRHGTDEPADPSNGICGFAGVGNHASSDVQCSLARVLGRVEEQFGRSARSVDSD